MTNPPLDSNSTITLESLLFQLSKERNQLDVVIASFEALRAAVSNNDASALESEITAVDAALYVAAEIRQERLGMINVLSAGRAESLLDLPPFLSAPVPSEFHSLCEELSSRAEEVSRHVSICQQIIRRAMQINRDLVRSTLSPDSVPATYDLNASPTSLPSEGGHLLDNTA